MWSTSLQASCMTWRDIIWSKRLVQAWAGQFFPAFIFARVRFERAPVWRHDIFRVFQGQNAWSKLDRFVWWPKSRTYRHCFQLFLSLYASDLKGFLCRSKRQTWANEKQLKGNKSQHPRGIAVWPSSSVSSPDRCVYLKNIFFNVCIYIICFSPPARWGLLDFMSVASSCLVLLLLLLLSSSSSFSSSSPLFSSPLLVSSPRLLSSCSLPDLNHDHPRPVFPAGPQPRPSTPSVPCRTSTASIRAQCSLPDLNHDHPRPVFPAGPQPRVSTPSVPCRTSCRKIWDKECAEES